MTLNKLRGSLYGIARALGDLHVNRGRPCNYEFLSPWVPGTFFLMHCRPCWRGLITRAEVLKEIRRLKEKVEKAR